MRSILRAVRARSHVLSRAVFFSVEVGLLKTTALTEVVFRPVMIATAALAINNVTRGKQTLSSPVEESQNGEKA
jgi:hypothetical protein